MVVRTAVTRAMPGCASDKMKRTATNATERQDICNGHKCESNNDDDLKVKSRGKNESPTVLECVRSSCGSDGSGGGGGGGSDGMMMRGKSPRGNIVGTKVWGKMKDLLSGNWELGSSLAYSSLVADSVHSGDEN
ncbi:hypothetical protein PV328_007407 [Microctonus aethiopoides]|uniref:Uncharacterized protein n=1 Tax=Microctonus aethiopoides TaxID=144406 RepID=A0AA39C8N2_9HYME|nr:hypothetical protein PV328_007407 [Microctonus aethiopoides]